MQIAIIDGNINGETIQTVNARELHGFLEVGKVFAAWITERIAQYGFEENVDYVVFSETGKNSSGGRPTKDYHISLDMAKELSMVERNEKGKEARQYFIECERRAKQPVALSGPQLMAAALIEADSTIKKQAMQIEEMREDVKAHERLTKADGSLNITEAAKNLGMRPKDLFSWLAQNGWIYKRPGAKHWLGYQAKCNMGLLEHKTNTVTRADGSEVVSEQVRVTAKGLSRLVKVIPPVAEAA